MHGLDPEVCIDHLFQNNQLIHASLTLSAVFRFYPGNGLSRPDWMKVVASRLYTHHGYSEEDLAKVIGGNFKRVLMNYLPD